MTLAEKIDGLLEARKRLFEDVNVFAGDVQDHRAHRWNGDHGVVWWENDAGKRHDASVFTRDWADKEGLVMYWDPKQQVWLVFSRDRCDETFKW